MNFIIWIVIGGVIGWLASMVMKTDAQQGIFLNIVVGIVGAFLAGWLLPMVGLNLGIGSPIVSAIIYGVIGAVILLFLIGLIKRA